MLLPTSEFGKYAYMAPHDPVQNVKWRKEMYRVGQDDEAAAQDVWRLCRRDLLFFVNTYCWTYNPRNRPHKPAWVPWIAWPEQEDTLHEITKAIGNYDLLIEKSRETGASWDCCLEFEWLWQFWDNYSFLMVSRNEQYVDKPENEKCLFWKVDMLIENQPAWLRPHSGDGFTRNKLILKNKQTKSVIAGESTTGELASGDRRTALLLDEFSKFKLEDGMNAMAATADVTSCRIINGTPRGAYGAYYQFKQKALAGHIKSLRLHWSQVPEKRAGLYTSDDSKLRIIDQKYKFPNDYPFICDGKIRSPWYDRECRRRRPWEVKQELDIIYHGSEFNFFDVPLLEKLEQTTAMPPFHTGFLDFDKDSLGNAKFEERENGPLRLWLNLNANGLPPEDRHYTAGGDVAVGTGASNSALSIADMQTGEKIGEYASANIGPEDFAEMSVAICKFFNNAYLIWEANGPGRQFTKRVMSLQYLNIYLRRDERSLSKKSSQNPGWWSGKGGEKREMLGSYAEALKTGSFVNHSKIALGEAKLYMHFPDQTIAHIASADLEDPTGARDNHGDRVIADGLCNMGIEITKEDTKEEKKKVPENSFAARRARYDKRQKAMSEEAAWTP